MDDDYTSITLDIIGMLEYLDTPDNIAKVIKLVFNILL